MNVRQMPLEDLVFTIKSKEICDLLREYGFKIEDIYGENPKDTISSNGTIIYPNGEELCVELAGTDELFCCVPKDTVFEWLIEFIGASHLWDKLKKDGKDIVKLKSDKHILFKFLHIAFCILYFLPKVLLI